MDNVFASPIKVTPSVEVNNKPMKKESVSLSPSILAYEKEKGKPYTTEHFKILEYPDLYKNPSLDIDGTLESIRMIEDYVKQNIELRGLQDDSKSFEFVMEEILGKIGKIDVEDIRHTFKRISKYVSKNMDVKGDLEKKDLQEQIAEINKKVSQLYGQR